MKKKSVAAIFGCLVLFFLAFGSATAYQLLVLNKTAAVTPEAPKPKATEVGEQEESAEMTCPESLALDLASVTALFEGQQPEAIPALFGTEGYPAVEARYLNWLAIANPKPESTGSDAFWLLAKNSAGELYSFTASEAELATALSNGTLLPLDAASAEALNLPLAEGGIFVSPTGTAYASFLACGQALEAPIAPEEPAVAVP